MASEECKCRKIGSPTEGAAGQPKERRGNRRSGRATEGEAGQPKERQGGPQRGLWPKKGFRGFGAEVIIQ